ncbi:hypothetical protein FCV25MIE_11756 [Fagus crenata]
MAASLFRGVKTVRKTLSSEALCCLLVSSNPTSTQPTLPCLTSPIPIPIPTVTSITPTPFGPYHPLLRRSPFPSCTKEKEKLNMDILSLKLKLKESEDKLKIQSLELRLKESEYKLKERLDKPIVKFIMLTLMETALVESAKLIFKEAVKSYHKFKKNEFPFNFPK